MSTPKADEALSAGAGKRLMAELEDEAGDRFAAFGSPPGAWAAGAAACWTNENRDHRQAGLAANDVGPGLALAKGDPRPALRRPAEG
ncbi:MAG TPA: hypothetical protein VMT20_21930 [Terriglobia bacterium]|nr:hypothetical protein [Terriglobia bacterium]